MRENNKIFYTILMFCATILFFSMSVVLIFSSVVQNLNNVLTVSYSANNVAAKVSATYQVAGSSVATPLTPSSSNSSIEGNAIKFRITQSGATGSLSVANAININDDNPYVLFTYKFENYASIGAYDYSVSLSNSATSSNCLLYYYYDSTGYDATNSSQVAGKISAILASPTKTTVPSSIYVPAQSQMYVYIYVAPSDLDSDASFSPTALGLSWTLNNTNNISN